MGEWEGEEPFYLHALDVDGQEALFDRYSRAGENSTLESPLTTDRPLARCIRVAVEAGAQTAVVEPSYIDLDYRSEYSSFYSRAFAHHFDTTHRVHFFGSPITKAEVWDLSADQAGSYKGYMVIRPQVRGVVGRTMLEPPASLRQYVRTKVQDAVGFFGRDLTVRAVPFVQQDARLAACAHAASWMCHYSAFLGKREVARKAMADFSAAAEPGLGLGRTLPSTGLTVQQISHLLGSFGIPPLHYEVATLRESDRPKEWPGRHAGTEGLVARICCRYLNSGLPLVVVARLLRPASAWPGPDQLTAAPTTAETVSAQSHDDDGELHALVPCGYFRDDDAPGGVRYVVHDDRLGPYLQIDQAIGHTEPESGVRITWEQLLVPLPEKLWMTAEAAERKGCEHLLAAARTAVGKGVRGPQLLLDLADADDLTVRTYAISASRFKRRLRERTTDPVLLSEYSFARLPKYVWVVEAIQRSERDASRPSVLGEVVFDSTSDDLAPAVLATRLPGFLAIPRPADPKFDTYIGTEKIESSGQYRP